MEMTGYEVVNGGSRWAIVEQWQWSRLVMGVVMAEVGGDNWVEK